ncbi:hypothetical protein ACFL36_01250 [Thermodesulfobacteriota bacterium]
MTIKRPKPNIFDKFLKFIGKRRGVKLPLEAYERFGQYAYAKAIKESFWKSLFRAKDKELPEGYVDLYTLINSD